MPATTIGFSGLTGGLITLLLGIAIIAFPRLLRFLVGFYFILVGLVVVLSSVL